MNMGQLTNRSSETYKHATSTRNQSTVRRDKLTNGSSYRHSVESEYSFHPMYNQKRQMKLQNGHIINGSLANNHNTIDGESLEGNESFDNRQFNVLDINDAFNKITNLKVGSVASVNSDKYHNPDFH